MIGRDGWAGLVVLASCAVLYWLTLGLKGNPLVPIGPAFYPRIVVGVAAFFAAIVLVQDLAARRARGSAKAPPPAVRPNYALVALQFAVFGVYVVALPYLGFRAATFLYVAAAAVLLAGARSWGKAAALALVTTAATYFVFERYLSVLLPRGTWTGI